MSRNIPSLECCIPFTVYFYSFHTYVTSFTHFTLHLLCIARAEHFLIINDAVDRRKLGFWILFFKKQQFKASLEQLYVTIVELYLPYNFMSCPDFKFITGHRVGDSM